MKNFFAIILIITAFGIFAYFVDPAYEQVSALRPREKSFKDALANTEELLDIRSQLQSKYNAFSAKDRERLDKILPDSADAVRIILEVNTLALKHNLLMKDVKTDNPSVPQAGSSGTRLEVEVKPYAPFSISLVLFGKYDDFLEFLNDVERSLRIMDVVDVSVKPSVGDKDKEGYEYSVGLRTYWFKSPTPTDFGEIAQGIDTAAAASPEAEHADSSEEAKEAKDTLVSNDDLQKEADQILAVLNDLRTIRLDGTFFSDKLFLGLVDWSIILSPEPKGRPNPFAPLNANSERRSR